LANLPNLVEQVFRQFRTCEFSTIAKDGTPITWPTLPFWDAPNQRFLITTSIALTQKVQNVRRNPKVALFFSDPTASGLSSPPAVLVQGDASAPDQVVTSITGFEEALKEVFRRQPSSALYSSNRLTQWLMDWYYMRLTITIVPRRIMWWPQGDMSATPVELKVA
jgi:hypothetical protein